MCFVYYNLVEESLVLDFKAADSLGHSDTKKRNYEGCFRNGKLCTLARSYEKDASSLHLKRIIPKLVATAAGR